MRGIFSTYRIAEICNVHHTTVINWVKKGALKAYTTPGGHRRVQQVDLWEFMTKYNLPLSEKVKKQINRVLVVDDDPLFLEELENALSNRGFELDFASSGFEAGRKIYLEKPHVILLDFKMPGMDGFRVSEILRKDKETAKIPIIAITALTSKEDRRRIKACGVHHYMAKPIAIDALLKLIQKILYVK